MPEIDSTSPREKLILPGIHAFDDLAGETADPAAADLPLLFALARPGVKPADDDYKPGEWIPDAPSPTGWIMVGTDGTLVPAGPGVWDIYAWVQGTSESPRAKVGQLVVT